MGDLFYVENMFREEQKKVKKRKKSGKATLSFALDDEGDGGADSTSGSATPSASVNAENEQRKKFRKNPAVDTSFLPDREREEAERREREELRQQWLKRQEEMKQEEIEITYSYWDGSGHRKSVVVSQCTYPFFEPCCSYGLQCKKGDDVATFLEKCRQQFPELRAVSVDNLMYIKVGQFLQRLPCLPELTATYRRISSYRRLVCCVCLVRSSSSFVSITHFTTL